MWLVFSRGAYATVPDCRLDPFVRRVRVNRHRGRRVFGRRRDRSTRQRRPLCPRSIDGPVDERPGGANLRARARHVAHDRAWVRGRGAVRARCRHAGGGGVRRAARRLQLDGVSRERGIRRVLDGHDRLRPIDQADRDERSVQFVPHAAGGLHPESGRGPMPAELFHAGDHDCFGLERHRCRRRSPARASPRRSREPRGLVAWRSARRWLRRAASRQGTEAGAAGARLQPYRAGQSAGAAWRERRHEYANARRVRGELEPPGRLSGPVRSGRERQRLVRNARIRPGRRDVGTRSPASAANGDMGLERVDGAEDAGADADGSRRARQAGGAGARA